MVFNYFVVQYKDFDTFIFLHFDCIVLFIVGSLSQQMFGKSKPNYFVKLWQAESILLINNTRMFELLWNLFFQLNDHAWSDFCTRTFSTPKTILLVFIYKDKHNIFSQNIVWNKHGWVYSTFSKFEHLFSSHIHRHLNSKCTRYFWKKWFNHINFAH